MLRNILFFLLIAFSACTSTPPNIVFIAVDDLRPELNCYGIDHIHSPNLDKLAASGFLFTNHYVSVPTCGASRFSLLTGNYPVSAVQVGNEAIHKEIAGKDESEQPESFVHHLKRNGYHTIGIGKISHYVDGLLYGYTEPVGTELELPHSWNEMLFDHGKWGTGWNAFFGYADGSNRQSMKRQVKPYESSDVDDSGYPDGLTTELALKKLDSLASHRSDKSGSSPRSGSPFLLAVGYFKPHLPFNAPKKYWDLYNQSDIPLTDIPHSPDDVHRASLHGSGEFNGYQLGEEKASLNGPLSDEYSQKLKHAYAACVSYIDAQIGLLMDKLEETGLDKNTHVIVWGDHGWHLGDHLVWGKHTVFDYATRSALLIREAKDERRKANAGLQIDRIVGTVDLYPTIMELCGIEMPHATDGQSLVALMHGDETANWDDFTFSYFRRGISLRTDRYRLTKYSRDQEPVIELYDHKTDPLESKNVAADHPEVVDSLMIIWKEGDTGLYK